MKGARTLVIGRSGQVARALVERAGAGADIVALGRPDIDLADGTGVSAAFDAHRPGLVVNAAAYTAVDTAESEPDAAHVLNAEAPGRLARLCAERDVPFIHLSTDYVFDGTADRPYRESDPIAPMGVYGKTKADGEAAVLAAGGRALVLRTAWVYSPFGKNFLKTMLRLGRERDLLRVVDDQHGNPTSALDIADGILALGRKAEDWPQAPTVFHMAGAGDATWCSFAREIFAVSSSSPCVEAITTADFPTPAKRPANSRLDCTALRERMGVMLPSWRDTLAEIVARVEQADP
ncbi:MAG: dTDP-4-dehydrorhamnose reductase [Pseudomonadota bacterium]